MMHSYQFKGLLTENGWQGNVVVTVDEQGIITQISETPSKDTEKVSGYALPGFQNAHSHAFQYAMAGLAELHEGTGIPDDFWSWRTAMYDLALQISPEQLEAIATMLYAEMVRHGYTSVAEFHYIHHDKNGVPYAHVAELGERLIVAAEKAGIRITLVPMFYQKGGFGKPAEAKQRRFISPTLELYKDLLDASEKVVHNYTHAQLGAGVHSLRAVEDQAIIELTQSLSPSLPFHIHVSEQLKEIEDCNAFYGKRPVEWLLDHVSVNENYHLVHATHLSEAEVKGIVNSKANVVLCPTTEGNLGDGLFRFREFWELGGSWSIGTDSHVSLNPLEELRLLDYGQRLISHKRNTFYLPKQGDSGFNALKMAWTAGRKAMGQPAQYFFAVGQPLDAVIMDAEAPLIAASGTQHLCNTLVYSSDSAHQLGTLVNGKWVVKNGQHLHKETITATFVKTLKELGSRM